MRFATIKHRILSLSPADVNNFMLNRSIHDMGGLVGLVQCRCGEVKFLIFQDGADILVLKEVQRCS
jgi:hypothetical protein